MSASRVRIVPWIQLEGIVRHVKACQSGKGVQALQGAQALKPVVRQVEGNKGAKACLCSNSCYHIMLQLKGLQFWIAAEVRHKLNSAGRRSLLSLRLMHITEQDHDV